MFLIDGKVLPVDTPFTSNGIQYPANWLRLSTQAEKEAIGITEEADTVRADDRFYWNGDVTTPKALEDKLETKQDGSPMWVQKYDSLTESMVDTDKQLVTKGLKSNLISQVKVAAGSILAQTDWMVIRKAERSIDIPEAIVSYRNSVITTADSLEASITAATSVEELAAISLSFPSQE